MKSIVLDVPRLYGDHHVIELRRVLLDVDGVESVDASSGFRTVEVSFDPAATSEDALRQRLKEAGYLGSLDVPQESGTPGDGGRRDDGTFFRHTEVHATTGDAVAFGQELPRDARPLWPCPGAAPAREMDD